MSTDAPDTRNSCDKKNVNHDKEPLPLTYGASSPGPSIALVPLKTVLELRAEDAVTDVYITIVPLKSANSVLLCANPLPFAAHIEPNIATVLYVLWLTMPLESICNI